MKLLKVLIGKIEFIPEWIWVTVIYVFVHLPALTLLPVFADEAIYIRWAQLIQDDVARYAFFSMADGKPPLFIWLLSIVLPWFHDPLFAGRFLSVFIGLITVFVMRALVPEFSKERIARIAVTAITMLLPFWFFYHRMALMDGLLTLFLALTFLFTLRLSRLKAENSKLKITLFLALSFGGAMMTKTPALFVIPIIALTPVYVWLSGHKRRHTDLLHSLLWVGLGGFLGGLLFLTLRISPLFGALFARSTDFTFSLKNLEAGEWRYVLLKSLPRNIEWIIAYVTPELFVLSSLGLWFKKQRGQILFLLLGAILFMAPLTLVGRVLWPRYFMPSIIFLSLAMGVSLTACLKQKTFKLIASILILLAGMRSFYFIATTFTNVAAIPFVEDDRLQYLAEWSAGYGNEQVREFIVAQQALMPADGSRRIIVLTEGSFGTLPDGLLMYFHDHNAQHLEIHGIGVSVPTIPEQYLLMAKTNDVYYMLNAHRFGLVDKSMLQKIFEIQRPNGPSLLFYKIIVK